MSSRSRPTAFAAVLVGLLAVLMLAAAGGPWLKARTTTVSAVSFTYDGAAFARGDADASAFFGAGQSLLSDLRERSASSSVGSLGASTTTSHPRVVATEAGTLTMSGQGFSASEQRVAQLLADGGENVVLREATGVGRTSDLLVNGVPYDVYTPTTGNIDRIVSAVASKGSQVQGGGIIIDLSQSPLTVAQLGNILPRVQGVTSQISDIRVVP